MIHEVGFIMPSLLTYLYTVFSYHYDFRPLHPLRLNKLRHHIIQDNQHLQSQQQTHKRFQQTIPEHLLRPRMAYRYYR